MGEKYHFLSWGKAGSGTWVDSTTLQDSIFDLDLEVRCIREALQEKRINF